MKSIKNSKSVQNSKSLKNKNSKKSMRKSNKKTLNNNVNISGNNIYKIISFKTVFDLPTTDNIFVYKDLKDEFKSFIDKVYNLLNINIYDDFRIGCVCDSHLIKNKFYTNYANTSPIKDYSNYYDNKNYPIFTLYLFTQIPEKIELELVLYDKKKSPNKKFKIFTKYEYEPIIKYDIKPHMVYIIPDQKYYYAIKQKNIIKEPLNEIVKYIWINGQTHSM